MTTQNPPRTNRFKGKPVADDGGKTEVPSAETHDARICALIDLGTHEESYMGEEAKPRASVLLVFELDEEMSGMKGINHVIAQKFTLSFHEKGALRKLAESLLNDGQKYAGKEIDYLDLLGQPCTVQISHVTKTGDNGERTYAKVGVIGAVNKKKREGFFAGKRKKASWFVDDDLDDLPDYLPRVFGEKVEDVIARCHERTGRKADEGSDEGEIADPDKETPF